MESKITDIFLVEFFQAQLGLTYTKLKNSEECHYIRLTNPTSSSAKEFSPKKYENDSKIYFDETYRGQVKKMIHIIANETGLDLADIYNMYIKYYTRNKNNLRLRQQLIDAIKTKLYEIYRSPKSIKEIRNIC
jgi:hypothetical protein